MGLPDVDIELGNGSIGALVATNDNTVAIVMTGATEGTVTAGTPLEVNNAADITALGLTGANNPLAVKTLANFVLEATSQGVTTFTLYVMLVANTMKINMMADSTNANGAIKLLNYGQGAIRFLGLIGNDTAIYTGGTTLAQTKAINDDVLTAVTNAQILVTGQQAIDRNLRVVIGGTSYTGVPGTLQDMTQGTSNAVAVLIGDTVSGNGSAIGTLMGRKVALPVMRKISRVRDGALGTATAFLGAVDAASASGAGTIHDKGYITFRVFPNKTGYFFTGDATCAATSDDYSGLARGFVIDKAALIAYSVFSLELDDEVPVNADGTPDAGYCAWLQQQVVNEISLEMLSGGEISAVTCTIDPDQNIVSTSELDAELDITPVGYASSIKVKLGYVI